MPDPLDLDAIQDIVQHPDHLPQRDETVDSHEWCFDTVAHCLAVIEALREALDDVIIRARRIREDKAVVGIEASYIERTVKAALALVTGGKKHEAT